MGVSHSAAVSNATSPQTTQLVAMPAAARIVAAARKATT